MDKATAIQSEALNALKIYVENLKEVQDSMTEVANQ